MQIFFLVKQTTKDAGYLGIIIAGIGVTGIHNLLMTLYLKFISMYS